MESPRAYTLKQRLRYTIHGIYDYEHPSDNFRAWLSERDETTLYNVVQMKMTPAFKYLLNTPQSLWASGKLEQFACNPRYLKQQRGCYLLYAWGLERSRSNHLLDIKVELYIGRSNEMARRYRTHVSQIKDLDLTDNEIPHFHRRCRQIGVEEPVFIPLVCDHTMEELALVFLESVWITIMGTWEGKNAPRHRTSTWKAVHRMRLADKDDNLPKGWHGANREIPFFPTRGLTGALRTRQI